MIERLKNTYLHLQDDLSRSIFRQRLMHEITGERSCMVDVIKSSDVGRDFVKQLETLKKDGAQIVIYGAGNVGHRLMECYEEYIFAFVDRNALTIQTEYAVYPPEWLKKQENIYVIPAFGSGTPKFREEVLQYLSEIGISHTHIIDVYSINKELWGRQYFDLPALTFADDEVFVDCGCFDGATIQSYEKWKNKPTRGGIIAFEPDDSMCDFVHTRMPHVKVINAGVWHENGTLRFKDNGGSLMKVADDQGDSELTVVRMDDALEGERVTFIKMDVEGAELNALKGAERIIREQRPKLAICVYHKPEDMLEIPALILSYHQDYRLYLRHYSVQTNETVLYTL